MFCYRIRFTSTANCNFVELHGLTVRLISGKDISNGYVTSLFRVTYFTEYGYNKREQLNRKRMEFEHNLLHEVYAKFFLKFIRRTLRLGR